MKNLILQIESQILKLESKLELTNHLKSKFYLIKEIMNLKEELTKLKIGEKDKEIGEKDKEIVEKEELTKLKIAEKDKEIAAITKVKLAEIDNKIAKQSLRGRFWADFVYDLEKVSVINDKDYFNCIDKFWNDIMINLEEDQRVMIKFMIELEDTTARTLSKIEFVTKSVDSLLAFKKLIKFNINNIYEHYINEEIIISAFVVRYKVLKPKQKTISTAERKLKLLENSRIHRTVKIASMNEILSTNPKDFGEIITQEGNVIKVQNKDYIFEFEINETSQIVKKFRGKTLIKT
jgi:hypothetical protein